MGGAVPEFSRSRVLLLRLFVLLVLWCFCLGNGPAAAATLEIPGTGDSQELLEVLAHGFMRSHPGEQVEIPKSIGSSGGIRRILAGTALIARVARPLKPAERQAGLQSLVFAKSPVVVAANLPVPCLTNLTDDQLVAIYSGEVSDWQELGTCSAHSIYVANREPGDSSRSTLELQFPSFKAVTEPVGETVYSTPETVDVLSRHPYTIAYVPLAALGLSSATVFSINGVAPTQEQVRAGNYPLVVNLRLVWKGDLPPQARQFVDYLYSPEVQRQIRSQGLVPTKRR